MRGRHRATNILITFCLVAGVGVAQAPAPAAVTYEPPPLINQWLLANPNFEESAETRAALTAFEAHAVQEVLEGKSMPISEAATVRALARNDIRAQMWADLGDIMLTPAAQRSADQSLIYTWFAKYVKETEKGAASAAIDEYVKWSGLTRDTYAAPSLSPQPKSGDAGYCNYRPPGPYASEFNASGQPICANTGSSLADLFTFSPPRPTYEDFVKYGQYLELNQLNGAGSNAYNPLSYNDLAAHGGQVAAITSMGVGLAASKIAVPIAISLSKPLAADSALVVRLFPFAARANFNPVPALVGQAKEALSTARINLRIAQAAKSAAAIKAASTAVGTAEEALLAANEARQAAQIAAKAQAAVIAGAEVFGGIASIVGAVVDIVVTTTLASIQINSDLALPDQLAQLYKHASNTSPDLGALLVTDAGYPALYATFLNLVLPEAEPDCTGFIMIGTELRECANPPAGSGPGEVPEWNAQEPQFLVTPTGTINASQAPRLWLELPDGTGTLFVRPHAEGWWILQEMLPDGSLTPEWLSTWFPFTDSQGDTFMAERTKDATGKYYFSLAPIGATADNYACYPGGGVSPPAGKGWKGCVQESITYVAAGGSTKTVMEMVHGAPPDPVTLPAIYPQITMSGPQSVIAGQPTTFTATVFDASGTPLTYEWLRSCSTDPSGFCFTAGQSLTVAFDAGPSAHVGIKVTNGYGNVSSQTRNLTVYAPTNDISFAQPADMSDTKSVVYGRDASTQLLNATASSALPVTIQVDPGSDAVCSIDASSVVTATAPGTCTLTATQMGGNGFPAATPVSRSFHVARVDYGVLVVDGSVQYSDPSPNAAPSVRTPTALDGVTGALSGCTRMDGLTDASGVVVVPPGNYPLSGCTGLSSAHFTLRYDAYTSIAPEDAVITNTSEAVTAPGVAVMIANVAQVNDGSPGDISRARVDFLLFRSTNSGTTPDYKVVNQQVNADGLVARTLEGLPPDNYRLVLRTSPSSAFVAPDVSTTLLVASPVAPSIGLTPGDVTVDSGQTATFTSSGNGTPKPTVQWFQVTSGPTFTEVAGATLPTLTLPAVTYARNGEQYIVRYTNASGTANSGIVTLTVRPAGPVVTTSPASLNVVAGSDASFTAAATGDPAPTVLWSTSTDAGASWTDVPGATSTTLTLPAVTQSQNGTQVRAMFTNVAGPVTTSVATLTVGEPPPVAPVVTVQPVDVTVTRRGTATFTAAASGSPAPSVQWQVSTDGDREWSNIRRATSTTLVVAVTNPSLSGNRYRAVFTNEAGRVRTLAARLTVLRR